MSIASDTRINTIKRSVCLTGLTDIMFDRYPGDNSTKLDWHQKLYFLPGTNIIAMPMLNIVSFLSAHNTNSAPKRLRDKRKYKDIANAMLSFCSVVPGGHGKGQYIQFERDGLPIMAGAFGDAEDPTSGVYLHRAVARLDKGIPNPKERPVLPLPWELRFEIHIAANKEIKEQEVFNLFSEGGLAIGLGTFRGVFGKFAVTYWE